MSIKAIQWAWDCPLKGIVKLVLLALADHANDDWECWPSQNFLSTKCGLTRRCISKTLTLLVESNYISTVRNYDKRGYRRPNVYKLNTNINQRLASEIQREQYSLRDFPTETIINHKLIEEMQMIYIINQWVMMDIQRERYSQQYINHLFIINLFNFNININNLSNNNITNISSTNTESTEFNQLEQFERFWRLYPNKYAKGKAKIVWLSLHPNVKKVDIILTSLDNQIFQMEIKTYLQCFCPNWLTPANWLAQEGWENEALTDVWEIKQKFDKRNLSHEQEQSINIELTLKAIRAPRTNEI